MDQKPVEGYVKQPDAMVDSVNHNKRKEEEILRLIDDYQGFPDIDKRWLAIAKTQIEQGFMAMNRALFKPTRVKLFADDKYHSMEK